MQNRRKLEKAAKEAHDLKRRQAYQMSKQSEPSSIHSIILYYFSNINF
jgi:hypothetical protein